MKRQLSPFLALFGLALAATPADAYCVVNESRIPLSVVLKTYSPLGEFSRVVEPGHSTCCDWFDRQCNPSGRREALVSLGIEQFERKVRVVDGDGTESQRKYVPIPTYDRYGNPDPNGHYDKFGHYDAHGWKPHFERIETFDKFGNPNPYGHYDRFGVYDAKGHANRRGRLVIPNRTTSAAVEDEPKKTRAHFCARGKVSLALATGAGTITVSEDSLMPGGLQCESRDHFLRPVSPPSQASEFGIPIKDLPVRKYAPGTDRSRKPAAR